MELQTNGLLAGQVQEDNGNSLKGRRPRCAPGKDQAPGSPCERLDGPAASARGMAFGLAFPCHLE